MWAASDIADWWDEQQRAAKKELDHFVDNNPNLFGVVVATAVATAMDVGAGTVDTLRFGEGMAEGGVKGFGKDALRLIGLLGPLGKGAKIIQTTRNARLARLIVDPGGGVCGWVSGAQALRQTGTKAFTAVDDLAAALGTTLGELGGSQLAARVALFKQIGARISPLKQVKSLEDVGRITLTDGSVTMFNIFGKVREGGRLKEVGHAVFAYRDLRGQLKILDRGGKGLPGRVFDSLEELAKHSRIEGQWLPKQAAVMENVFAKFFGSISSAPVFAMATYAVAGVNRLEQETVAQAFEVHKVVMRQGKRALEQSPARYYTVVSGDSLSKIAGRNYNNVHKWPIIYEANRDVVGGDPNLIKQGQRLLIPALPSVKGIA